MNHHSSPHAGLRARFKVFILLIFLALLVLPLVGVALFLVEIEDAVYCKGTIIPEDSYEVVAHISARVTKLHHRTGDEVKEGEVIAELDSLTYENDALSAESAISELKAECEVKKAELAILRQEPLPKELWHTTTSLDEAKKKLEKSNEKLERYRQLNEANAVSKIDFDAVQLENIQLAADFARAKDNMARVKNGYGDLAIQKARNDLDLVQSKLQNKINALKFYQKLIDDCKLRAPANGRIVEIPCRNTMYVERGKTAVTVAGGQNLMVIAEVDERFIRKIRLGQIARISSEVFNRLQYGSFHATVERIGYIPMREESGMAAKYPVKLRLDSDGCDIRIGSKTEVTIITGMRPAIFAFLNITEDDIDMKRRQERKRELSRQIQKTRAVRKVTQALGEAPPSVLSGQSDPVRKIESSGATEHKAQSKPPEPPVEDRK